MLKKNRDSVWESEPMNTTKFGKGQAVLHVIEKMEIPLLVMMKCIRCCEGSIFRAP